MIHIKTPKECEKDDLDLDLGHAVALPHGSSSDQQDMGKLRSAGKYGDSESQVPSYDGYDRECSTAAEGQWQHGHPARDSDLRPHLRHSLSLQYERSPCWDFDYDARLGSGTSVDSKLKETEPMRIATFPCNTQTVISDSASATAGSHSARSSDHLDSATSRREIETYQRVLRSLANDHPEICESNSSSQTHMHNHVYFVICDLIIFHVGCVSSFEVG